MKRDAMQQSFQPPSKQSNSQQILIKGVFQETEEINTGFTKKKAQEIQEPRIFSGLSAQLNPHLTIKDGEYTWY